MKMLRVLFASALIAGVPGIAANPPPTMMANVYRLAESAAVLQACIESAAYGSLARDKALQVQSLVTRIGDLVRNIATHYKDGELLTTFEMTKAKIADEPEMKGYVSRKYQNCGDRLFQDMEAYVAENEKLINGYFTRQSAGNKGVSR